MIAWARMIIRVGVGVATGVWHVTWVWVWGSTKNCGIIWSWSDASTTVITAHVACPVPTLIAASRGRGDWQVQSDDVNGGLSNGSTHIGQVSIM